MTTNAIHGKNAIVYLGANGGAAIPITEMADWSVDMENQFVDVSQLGVTWKNFVKGMIGWSVTVNGNFNPGSSQLWLASVSNYAEKVYVYPTVLSPTNYYYGTAWITLNKIAAGSTTTKASTGFKGQGTDQLYYNP